MRSSLSLVWLVLAACATPATGRSVHPGAAAQPRASVKAVQRIQAESYNVQVGGLLEDCEDIEGGMDIYGYEEGGVVGYFAVDFQDGLVSSKFRVSADAAAGLAGQIYVHLDNVDTTPFLTVPIEHTGGRQDWVTRDVPPTSFPTGVHSVFFTFKQNSDIHNSAINWFSFETQSMDSTTSNRPTSSSTDITNWYSGTTDWYTNTPDWYTT